MAVTAAHLLRRARRRARLSQRELGRLAGIPQSTVARVELGTLSPRTDTLERLLRAAGQSLSLEPLLGVGIDRTQMIEAIRLSPEQRLDRVASGARMKRMLGNVRRVGAT